MKNVGNSSRGRSQGVPKIFRAPCTGPLRGHLCDSTAFLLLNRFCRGNTSLSDGNFGLVVNGNAFVRFVVINLLLYAEPLTRMGDCLRASTPSWYITTNQPPRSTQPSIPWISLRLQALQSKLIEYQPFWLGLGRAQSLTSGGS